MTATLSATPTEVSEWIKVWSVEVYDFHKKKLSLVLDNEAAKWKMVLRELAVERPMIHKTGE